MTTTRKSIAVLLLVALVASACGSGESGDEDRLSVMATTTMLGDVVENLTADDASVEVLVPIGADSHDFQPSSVQIARINEADLVIANGLGLEEGLHDVLESAEQDGVAVLEVAPMLHPLPFDDEDASDHEEEHGSQDPHVWFDPLRMAEAARIMAERLSEIEPEIDWSARAQEYAAELAKADAEISAILSSVPESNRRLVTSHESMGYFAERYDFDIVGVIIPGGSTLGDPSSGELSELIEVMRRENVRAIFGETTQPSALADAVAAELDEGVRVVNLYTESLGEPGSEADTLIGMLLTNAELIAEALGG